MPNVIMVLLQALFQHQFGTHMHTTQLMVTQECVTKPLASMHAQHHSSLVTDISNKPG